MKGGCTIGFIGLGAMGEHICRNLAMKVLERLLIFDLSREAVERLRDTAAIPAQSAGELVRDVDLLFLSLPGGNEVQDVIDRYVIPNATPGTTVVDLSTTPVALTRKLGATLRRHGIEMADAPVARTQEAARKGKLSVMVGSEEAVFNRILPYLELVARDVTHCGPIGSGQVVKLINNMLVFESVVALGEMMMLADAAGVTSETLLLALSRSSSDSFVLRNHGFTSMLTQDYPKGKFPLNYALKDISYILQLAEETGALADVAEFTSRFYHDAAEMGLSNHYFPSVSEVFRSRRASQSRPSTG